MIQRFECQARDAADPLAHTRARFDLPDGLVYLDGNSLGALPVGVAERVARTVSEEWGRGLVGSWNDAGWIDLPDRVGERIARLIGAEPGTVITADSTSVNLHKVVAGAAAMRPDRTVIVSDRGNFPTDVYVLAELARRRGLELRLADPAEVGGAIDHRTAVVVLTEVDYRTGRRHDLGAITAATHDAGALVAWDLAHSAGAFPVALAAAGADFAVGCGYKYLNGGPGAPAFAYVAPRHQEAFSHPLVGWFGHRRPFDFDLEWEPVDGIRRLQVGTPHLLSLVALDAALDAFDDVDLELVREKSVALTSLFIDLVDARVPQLQVATPRDPAGRGSHVSLRHPSAHPIVQALIARGIIGDFRAPDLARFGFCPLYVRHVDVWDAVDGLAEVMESGEWADRRFTTGRGQVT